MKYFVFDFYEFLKTEAWKEKKESLLRQFCFDREKLFTIDCIDSGFKHVGFSSEEMLNRSHEASVLKEFGIHYEVVLKGIE